MRPDAAPRWIREAAMSGPFAGPRLLLGRQRAMDAAVIPHPEGSTSPVAIAKSGAERPGNARNRLVNMVVKPLPDFHNHACLRLVRRSDLDCFTATSVIWGASELQLRRAFFIDHWRKLQLPPGPPEIPWAVPGQVRLSCPHPWPAPCGAGQFLRDVSRRAAPPSSAPAAAAVRTICCGSIVPSRRRASATWVSSTSPSRSR